MKQMKKFASLLLVLVMVFAMMSVTAYAAGTNTITVKNAVSGQKYELYKILDLSVNDDHTAYSYTVNSAWADFFKTPDGKGLTYVSIDTLGYVTWKDNADVAAFAKDAEAFAKDLTAVYTITATADGGITFSDLEAGYYLVTSTLGTKATVGTTPGNPNPEIQEKNQVPTNVKTVEEDSTPGVYGSTNDADIGQTVNFKSTITAKPGAENYVFEDTMSAGLTYKNDAKVYTDEAMTTELAAGNYTVDNNPGGGKTFTITFKQSYLDTITAETKLYVKYSATLNENAKVGLEGNENKSTLKYGDVNNTKSTPDSKTTTYTWEINVYKYTMVKVSESAAETEKALANAEFILYKDVKNNNDSITRYYATAAAIDGGYRFTEWTTDKEAATKFITPDSGKFAIKGLDSDTYYLEETTAPAGYNMLKDPVKVIIDANGNVTYGEDDTTASPDVKVLNQSGPELPSTGGMGTTIFYVLGSLLVVAAGVLLVTKKRMGSKA